MSPRSAPHIVIVGAMGSGKTTVGRELARRLGWGFADSDELIVARHSRNAREIARLDGVKALHQLEREALLEALGSPRPTVVAAAASVVDDPEARAAIDRVFCVWLDAEPDILARRGAIGDHRRSVSPGEGLEHRRARYEQVADVVVDTGVLSVEDSVGWVLAVLDEGG